MASAQRATAGRAAAAALLCAVVAVASAACTGGPGRSGAVDSSSISQQSAARSVSAAPTVAAEVQARICLKVPLASVDAFFTRVIRTAVVPHATACRAISNTAAGWGNKGTGRPDLLVISVFDRSYGKQCGLNSYGNKIEDISLEAHAAAVVNRGSSGGLFLCWSSSANRVVLMGVNTPPSVSYASIKSPAISLARALIGRL